jgi:uncharacterized protein YbjT (DUF2867 family)
MASTESNVLVFGPTGNVGLATAVEARAKGANVWLAMRDPNKAIEGLDVASDFARVQADLSVPSSLESAVKQSGAKSAFVYTVHGQEDNMKESFNALKRAGITYIVLLSSWGVKGSASDEANMSLPISAVHALTEVALQETGIKHAVIRPGYFSTNTRPSVPDIVKGRLEAPALKAVFDYISPQDIGSVCGSLLVNQTTENLTIVTLCGPTIMTQREAFEAIGRALERPVEVIEMDEETFVKSGTWPEHRARGMMQLLSSHFDRDTAYPKELYEEAAANVKKYSGREPTRLEDWVKANKSTLV